MGALFELLAQLLIGLATAALAQLGAGGTSDRQGAEPPSVQRTVLQTGPRAAARPLARDEDCPDAAALRTA